MVKVFIFLLKQGKKTCHFYRLIFLRGLGLLNQDPSKTKPTLMVLHYLNIFLHPRESHITQIIKNHNAASYLIFDISLVELV
jgi:hypothetical protein